MLKEKVCPCCKKNKDAKEYVRCPKNISGLATYCKQCQREKGYADGLKQYGMTLDDYNDMFDRQEGCCKICGRHQSELNHRLYVDHNHESGQVRALLCSRCNLVVGIVEKNDIKAVQAYIAIVRP